MSISKLSFESEWRKFLLDSRTVATYQTLLQNNRIDKFDPSKLKAVIVDEAHHAAAPS